MRSTARSSSTACKGQFAFSLVDLRRRIVLLARDRVGICPLFISRQGDSLYFGSEIKALIASGAVAPRADPRGLDHLFTFFALGGRRTMFQGVQAIAPGHYVKIAFRTDGGVAQPVECKYWDFDFPDWGDEDNPTESSAIDAFERDLCSRGGSQAPCRCAGGRLSQRRRGFSLCAGDRGARGGPCVAQLHRARDRPRAWTN